MAKFRIHGDVEMEDSGLTKYGSAAFQTPVGLISTMELLQLGFYVERVGPDQEIVNAVKTSGIYPMSGVEAEHIINDLRARGFDIVRVDKD